MWWRVFSISIIEIKSKIGNSLSSVIANFFSPQIKIWTSKKGIAVSAGKKKVSINNRIMTLKSKSQIDSWIWKIVTSLAIMGLYGTELCQALDTLTVLHIRINSLFVLVFSLVLLTKWKIQNITRLIQLLCWKFWVNFTGFLTLSTDAKTLPEAIFLKELLTRIFVSSGFQNIAEIILVNPKWPKHT